MKKLNFKKKPLVSVIMPVYNTGSFLVDAIESILNQTYKNFEFIIINDASTDNSLKIIKKYAEIDKRIKIINNKKRLGLAKSLNKGIKISKGEFIARMDSDDVSFKNRLEKQIKYLKRDQNLIAVGSQVKIIDNLGKIIGKKQLPTDYKSIKNFAFKFNPVSHPTLVIKREKLPKDFVFYDQKSEGAEDLNILFKLINYGKVENLKDYLLKYRIHGNNFSFNKIKKIFLQALLTRINAILKYHYIPNFWNFIFMIIQTIFVLILPEKLILFLYMFIRIKKFKIKNLKLEEKSMFQIKPAYNIIK